MAVVDRLEICERRSQSTEIDTTGTKFFDTAKEQQF
jgi:hypothetical protein